MIAVIKASLENLRLALDGLIVITPDLEMMSDSMLKNQIPANWKKASYPSLKDLGRYVQD